MKKIPYPTDGIILVNGSRFIYGESSVYSEKAKAHVTKYYFVKKYERCDHANCDMRGTFYGFDQIGPRVYSVHKCIMGHAQKTRLVQNDGPELSAYLKQKHAKE